MPQKPLTWFFDDSKETVGSRVRARISPYFQLVDLLEKGEPDFIVYVTRNGILPEWLNGEEYWYKTAVVFPNKRAPPKLARIATFSESRFYDVINALQQEINRDELFGQKQRRFLIANELLNKRENPIGAIDQQRVVEKLAASKLNAASEISQRNFQESKDARGTAGISDYGVLPENVEITFEPTVSPEQVLATLTALADYYRACGGVGLSAEFESQECVTEEVHA